MTNSKTTAADENIPDDFSENFIGEGDEEEPPQWFMDMIQKARKKAMKNFPPAPPGVCNDFSEEDKNACEGFYEDENEDFCEGLCEYEYFCENFCKQTLPRWPTLKRPSPAYFDRLLT